MRYRDIDGKRTYGGLLASLREMPDKLRRTIYGSVVAIVLLMALIASFVGGHRKSPYDPRKVALLIENRPMPHLTPLLLHFTSVIPPDWRVRFMGGNESVAHVNASHAIRHQVDIGKMDLTYIPSNMSVSGTEPLNQFLTTPWVYDTLLQPAEWLLIFQTDSILCANSMRGLNEWLEYDWVGAPWWKKGRRGGNGGLSLRRVSALRAVLQEARRPINGTPEDLWFSQQLSKRPGGNVPSNKIESDFSSESAYSIQPMGYHTGGSGSVLGTRVWGNPGLRNELYDWCPEIKMTLDMDVADYIPGDCNQRW